MADEYPFIPCPFSERPPEPARFAQPAPPAQPVNPWVPPPPPSAEAPREPAQEMHFDIDDDDETAHKTALAIIAGILIFLALAGLGAWYFLSGEGDKEVSPAPLQEQNLVLAAVGGVVATPEGAAIVVPPGALSQNTRVEIIKVRDGEVTDLFELKPLGLKFLKPVTVEIPYKKSGPIVLEYWREEEEGEEKKALRYTIDRKEKKLRTLLKEL